jgi:hypothetical protein
MTLIGLETFMLARDVRGSTNVSATLHQYDVPWQFCRDKNSSAFPKRASCFVHNAVSTYNAIEKCKCIPVLNDLVILADDSQDCHTIGAHRCIETWYRDVLIGNLACSDLRQITRLFEPDN